MRWNRGKAKNDALLLGPWTGMRVTHWAITKGGEVLDSGELRKPHVMRPGDRMAFPRGSIKAAAVGDVLGITCVFMPSGFAVGVPPPATAAAATGGGPFAYDGQIGMPWIFWLPKRKWDEMPKLINEQGQWQKRMRDVPDTGVHETVRRSVVQQLIAAEVI